MCVRCKATRENTNIRFLGQRQRIDCRLYENTHKMQITWNKIEISICTQMRLIDIRYVICIMNEHEDDELTVNYRLFCGFSSLLFCVFVCIDAYN